MTPEEIRRLAEKYVDSALAVQKRSGQDPQVSQEAYAAAVDRAARGFAELTDKSERPDEDAIPA